MERHFENKFAYYRIDNEMVFLEIKPDVVLDIEAAIAITGDRMAMQIDKCYPILFDVNNLAGSDKPGRDYLAHSGWCLAKRVAILAVPFRSLVIAKFYLHINKPKVLTKLFMDPNGAVQFLHLDID